MDDISLRDLINKVLANHEPIEVLLNDLNFQRRARQICKRFAGGADTDDLVQQTCLRVVHMAHKLERAELQNEKEFFRWFFVIAKNLHLQATRLECTDQMKQWPDTTSEIACSELDSFFEHAELCPYHRGILTAEAAAEERKFESMVEVARGLDPHGAIRCVADFKTELTEIKRELKIRKEANLDKEFPFDFIALYSNDKEIATVSRLGFYTKTHKLDTRAGLQICGLTKKSPKRVLIGFYALAGVHHENIEQHLHLASGYTVGLTITQCTETEFTICFRYQPTGAVIGNMVAVASQEGRSYHIPKCANSGKALTGVPALPSFLTTSSSHSRWPIAGICGVVFLLSLSIPVYLWRSGPEVSTFRSSVAKSRLRSTPDQNRVDRNVDLTVVSLTNSPANDLNKNTVAGPKEQGRPGIVTRKDKQPVSAANHVKPANLIDIKQHLAVEISPTANILAANLDNTKKKKYNETRVDLAPYWQLRVYERGATAESKPLVTHLVDNEQVKNRLQQFISTSASVEVVKFYHTHETNQSEPGFEVIWKTESVNEKIMSVEVTIDLLGHGTAASSTVFTETCLLRTCEDSLLVARALDSVYGKINPAWKSQIELVKESLLNDRPKYPTPKDPLDQTQLLGGVFRNPTCIKP